MQRFQCSWKTCVQILPLSGHVTVGNSHFFCLFRAAPMAHGGSQTGVKLELQPAGLHHSHIRSKLCLDLHHSSWQHQILNPLREVRDRICSRICFRCATVGTPHFASLPLGNWDNHSCPGARQLRRCLDLKHRVLEQCG